MKSFFLYLWQLPQNIVGFIIAFFCGDHTLFEFADGTEQDFYYVHPFFNSGVSLGNFILLDLKYQRKRKSELETVLRHEHGHQIQSKYLGWLYLVVIGIPSLCGNLIDRIFHKKWSSEKRSKWYYSRFPENWADKLGEVER